MSIDRKTLSDNAAQGRRLEALVSRLSVADLQRDLGGGWTVAVGLAHLGFYDRRAALVLQRWDGQGSPPAGGDTDILNDALFAEWLALPPRRAAELALAAAKAVDAIVDAADARMVDAIRASGEDWLLHRSRHRREHLDQIEQLLRG